MDTVEKMLKREMNDLKQILERTKKRLRTAPKGHIRIHINKKCMEFYYKSENDVPNYNGRYLRRNERQIAEKIVQRDYDQMVLRKAEERIKAIDTFLKKYTQTDLQNVYLRTHPLRQSLLTEAFLPDDEYAKRWQSIEYNGKSFSNVGTEIITERGERVRSKSEKIIADKLFALGIPYRYEYPLVLKDNIIVYPDFTILRKTSRKEVYLEHFGMMDDKDYLENVLLKLNTYAKNQIYQGINLFCTYETGKQPLNVRTLDGFLREMYV